MIRRPPRSTLFPTRRSSDLFLMVLGAQRSDHDVLREQPRPSPLGHGDVDQRHNHPAQIENSQQMRDRKSTRLNSSHSQISYAVFCLKKKNTLTAHHTAAVHN